MTLNALEQIGRRAILKKVGGSLFAMVAESQVPSVLAQAVDQSIQIKKDFGPTEIEKADLPEPDAPKNRVGFAVVGLGRLALQEIIPAFAQCKHAYLAGLVSGTPDKLRAVGERYGVPRESQYSYDTFDEIKNNPAIQVVYIVLPNSMHLEFTQRAAAASKHVLSEKPMATSVRECEQMIEACDKTKKLLMVAYRMQYETNNREIVRLTRSGELGKLRTFAAQNSQSQGDPTQWRCKLSLAGGGALPDIGLYCLNAVRFITGEEPIKIQAMSYSTPGDARFREVEEVMAFNLEFSSGVIAQCHSSYDVHNSRRLRLGFENGWIDLDPAFSYKGQQLKVGRKLNDRVEEISERKMDATNQFTAEMDHMAQCVLTGTQPHTGGAEGLQDQRLMAAIYEAAKTGKTSELPRVNGLDSTRGPQPLQGPGV